jgi:hypothetical protein
MNKSPKPPSKRVELRPGVGKFPPRMRGINRQLDPGAVPSDQFWNLQNARLQQGEVVSRGGLTKVFDSAVSGSIYGLFDDGNGNVGSGGSGSFADFYGASATATNEIFTVDTATDTITTFADSALTAGDDRIYSMEYFDGALHYLVVHDAAPPNGRTWIRKLANGATSSTLVCTLDNLGETTGGLVSNEAGTALYATQGPPSAGSTNINVFKWDGASVTDLGFVITPKTVCGTLNYTPVESVIGCLGDEPFLSFGGATESSKIGFNEIHRYSGGSWSSLAMPGGISGFHCYGFTEFNSELYAYGFYTSDCTVGATKTSAGVLIKWNGSSLSTAHTIGNAAADQYTIYDCCEFNGQLIYIWGRNAYGGSADLKVGTYDGATFTDSAKNLTSQFAALVRLSAGGRTFAASNGSLYLIGANGRLYKSPNATVAGTWTDVGAADVIEMSDLIAGA